jgi:hypothetical protein
MDDPSGDLSPESPEGHPPRMNGRWQGFYTLGPLSRISLWDKYFFFGSQQRLLLTGGPSLLPFFPLSYDLLLTIDIYP